MKAPVWVGVSEGHWNPAVAVVRNGKLLSYMEEERLVRVKHAPRHYPIRALRGCLHQAGIEPWEVSGIAVNWNLPAYSDGTMKAFYAEMQKSWRLDDSTLRWQNFTLGNFSNEATRQRHFLQWRRAFGNIEVPEIFPLPHHYIHALHAYLQSPFKEALCLTIDGSGDQHCTVLWECRGEVLKPVREIFMPHSLGWFYAAFTEYLGFEAYDGEYKVMGLAAYGHPDPLISQAMERVLMTADDGIEYRIDPKFLHYGQHTWSDRFTDDLVLLFNHPKRLPEEPITNWHENLAFAVQEALEESVCRLVSWGISKLGLHNICIGGGVGLNVKMNSRLFTLDGVTDVFAQPLCNDGGAAAGAALGVCWKETEIRPELLSTLALGHEETEESIEFTLQQCGIRYHRVDDIAETVAAELAGGRIVGWFQGRMEAGPRSLGQRSILADPRHIEVRDRLNQAVKFREYWRPFCPSMPIEEARRYLKHYTEAPFMILAFEATDELIRDAPAVVHVDGTVRVQLVRAEVLPLYYRLLRSFARRTGVPVLVNTSFNVKGEPIVCTISDALRTFFASGLDVLAAGRLIIHK